MAETEAKKGGFFRIVFWILFIYLIANFCWNNQPLYRLIWPENSTEMATDNVEKLKEEVLDSVEQTKNKILEKKTAVIPEEDKESLKKLIEQKATDGR